MYNYISITDDVFWIGGNDRRISLFENAFPVPNGVSYNSYFVNGEKTVVVDTVDKAICGVFFENIAELLKGRKLDYVIVNHMEPDHSATLSELVLRYPEVQIICNEKTLGLIKQFFVFNSAWNCITVSDGDTFLVGKNSFKFIMAPMVHWPEVMVTYIENSGVLFSADAFGTFGALNGNIFADELDFKNEWLPEARRYYTNIVGKYGTQVQSLLKKASGLDIKLLCPLHGPVWRKNIGWFVEKYDRWSRYVPEDNTVLIIYASIYGNTQNAAEILASKLSHHGVNEIKVYDVSAVHSSVLVAEAFRCSHIVLASATYNAGVFSAMQNLLSEFKAHNLSGRKFAVIENGSWAATAGKLIRTMLSEMKNTEIIGDTISIKSSLKEDYVQSVEVLSKDIASSVLSIDADLSNDTSSVEQNAMFALSYGLYLVTAKDNSRDNGCIVNTVIQVTDSPKQISVTINKANLTHDMILKSGMFNVSVLTIEASYNVYKHFGFQSGREVDKLCDYSSKERSGNGLVYITDVSNAFLSARVVKTTDLGTHTEFVAVVTEAKKISDSASATYQYYFDSVKPKPIIKQKKKGFICKICGYIYEGDVLPADFICPLCKHGVEDFEPLSE